MKQQTSNTISDAEEQQCSPAALLGQQLRTQRLKLELTLEQAAQKMGTRINILEAMERGVFKGVEAPIYMRGYYRRYLNLLKLPLEDYLLLYQQLGISEHPPVKSPPLRKPLIRDQAEFLNRSAYIMVIGVVVALVWLGIDQVSNRPITRSSPPLAASSTKTINSAGLANTPSKTVDYSPLATANAAELPPLPSRHKANQPTTVSALTASQSPTSAQSLPGKSTGRAPTSLTSTSEALKKTPGTDPITEKPPVRKQDELVLSFSGDCWLKVRDANGKRLAYGLMKSDTQKTILGKAPFSVVLGNSGATTLTFNGKAVNRKHYVTRRSVSQFVLKN